MEWQDEKPRATSCPADGRDRKDMSTGVAEYVEALGPRYTAGGLGNGAVTSESGRSLKK